MPNFSLPRLLHALLAALLLTACMEEDTSHAWKLDRLRVLGMSAKPAALQPGETAEVSVLVTDEPLNRPTTLLWLGCLPDPHNLNRSPCADSEILKNPALLMDAQGNMAENIHFLGMGSTAFYSVAENLFSIFPAEHPQRKIGTVGMVLLLVVAEALPEEPALRDIALLVQRAQNKQVDSQITLFRIPVRESDEPANNNPLISTMTVEGLAEDTPSPLPLKQGQQYVLNLVVPEESFEDYIEITSIGSTPKTELLFASFFSTCGELEDSEFNLATSVRPKLRVPQEKEMEACPSPLQKLFAVVRDTRGGQTWYEQPFVIIP
ncbi:MAG: hypothetical protein FWG75_08830 [Cystobacterineae bacterium]|nr:hypothetical protein [Cystobacterineae bacterium]